MQFNGGATLVPENSNEGLLCSRIKHVVGVRPNIICCPETSSSFMVATIQPQWVRSNQLQNNPQGVGWCRVATCNICLWRRTDYACKHSYLAGTLLLITDQTPSSDHQRTKPNEITPPYNRNWRQHPGNHSTTIWWWPKP